MLDILAAAARLKAHNILLSNSLEPSNGNHAHEDRTRWNVHVHAPSDSPRAAARGTRNAPRPAIALTS